MQRNAQRWKTVRATERENVILEFVGKTGFGRSTTRTTHRRSPATLRRFAAPGR
jgi:hypothetical protein